MSALYNLWASGFVNRWHTHPDPRLRNSHDTTAAHSQRVAILVSRLWWGVPIRPGDSTRDWEIVAALLHDAPECFTGDIPAGAKRDEPLRAALETLEIKWQAENYAEVLITPLVKLCDTLDAILFCHLVAPDLLRNADWQSDIAGVRERAANLSQNVRIAVDRLLEVIE